VAGGTLGAPSELDIEAYVAAVDLWSGEGFVRGASLAVLRARHTATALSDGRVVILGGSTDMGLPGPAFAVEVWDPASEAFSTVAELDFNLIFHCAVPTPDDQVLVIDDCEPEGCTAARIDPSSGAVTLLDALPSYRYALDVDCAPTADGRVLLAGGLVDGAPAEAFELLDPSSGSFESLPAPAAFGADTRVVALTSGEVLVVGDAQGVEPGGSGVLGAVYGVDGSVRALSGGALNRVDHVVTPLADGRALISGGTVAGSPDLDDAPGVDLVDVAAGTVAPVPGSAADFGVRHGHAGAMVDGGPALLIGGLDESGRVASVHRYY